MIKYHIVYKIDNSLYSHGLTLEASDEIDAILKFREIMKGTDYALLYFASEEMFKLK